MKTILFADNDDANSKLLLATLSMLGYDACRARNGRDLLRYLGHLSPDLVILDIEMPGLDGLETVQFLLQDARFRDLPVLAATATNLPEDRNRLCGHGFTDCMAKPIAMPELIATLSKYLNKPAASLLKTPAF